MMLKRLRQKTPICQFAGGFAVKAKLDQLINVYKKSMLQ